MGRSSIIATSLCVALAGCSATLHGNQTTTTVTSSSAVAGSAQFAGGQFSVSSGAVPAPGAPGGLVVLGGGVGAALLVGAIIVDAVIQLAARHSHPPSRTVQAPASILETCSCFGYKPVSGEP